MALHYFHHLSNGIENLDADGTDLKDLGAVREEAIRAVRESLNLRQATPLWSGDPWKVWVTDQPNAAGKTVLTLELRSR